MFGLNRLRPMISGRPFTAEERSFAMTQALIRPNSLCAWHGQSLLVLNTHGECDPALPLAGFYFREARHLHRMQLRLNGAAPWLCEAAAESPEVLAFNYVHPELTQFGGGGSGASRDELTTDEHGIPHRSLDLRVRHEVGVASLRTTLIIANRSPLPVAIEVAWHLAADFADIQEAQAGTRQQEAEVFAAPEPSALRLTYAHPQLPYQTLVSAHGDGHWESFSDGFRASLRLTTGESLETTLLVTPVDFEHQTPPSDVEERQRHWQGWRDGLARIEMPPNSLAEEIVRRNVRDLASFPLLEGAKDEWLSPQAGVPLYPALFGRDALTAGWQAAMLDRGTALDASLTMLGSRQSDKIDDWRDAEPGRIPFQIRRGPLARLGVNPFAAYYADFASPLMFVVALAHLYSWTGERSSLERHWDTARRILDWARDYGDRDGDGYLEYLTRSPDGPKNQGWKDSGRAILYPDGSPVPAPIATCELQGYWYAAQQLMAMLSVVMGARDDARGPLAKREGPR